MDIRGLFNFAWDNRIKFDWNYTINKFNSIDIRDKNTALTLLLDFIRYIPSTWFVYPKQEMLLWNSELFSLISSNPNKEKICWMAMFWIMMNYYKKYSLENILEKLWEEDITEYWRWDFWVDKMFWDNPESYLKWIKKKYYLYIFNDIQRLKTEAKDDIIDYYRTIFSWRDLEILDWIVDLKIEWKWFAMKKMILVNSYLYYLLWVSLDSEDIKNDAKWKISNFLPDLILE